MIQRVGDRRKWRMPCEVRASDRRHSGFVLDLSPTGLFVQTSAKVAPGQELELALWLEDEQEVTLSVSVARKKVVPARLLTVAQGGIGVRIRQAPEAFYAFLRELGITGAPPVRRGAGVAGSVDPPTPGRAEGGTDATEAEPASPRFRVRVSQVSGPRSRRLDVEAPDADAAAETALGSVGEGWKVLDVEPL